VQPASADFGGDQSGRSRRDQILWQAQNLFAEQGFRETNLNDVAERLGITRQALYHYFKSKDEILVELIQAAGRKLEQSAESAFAADITPSQKLVEIVRNHVRQVLSNADGFRVQFDEMSKIGGERGELLRKSQAAYVRRVARVISEGQRAGAFVDVPPTAQALLIIGTCNGTVNWFRPSSRLGIDQIADHAARTVVSGVERRT